MRIRKGGLGISIKQKGLVQPFPDYFSFIRANVRILYYLVQCMLWLMKKENTKWENENIKIFLFGDLNELMTKYRRENLFIISNIQYICSYIHTTYICIWITHIKILLLVFIFMKWGSEDIIIVVNKILYYFTKNTIKLKFII